MKTLDNWDKSKLSSKLYELEKLIQHKPKKLKIFLSYSHKDEMIKERLNTHLVTLRRSNKILTWDDRKISGGTEWDEAIKKELKEADIILLLISADFIASDYIWNIEIKQAIERHNKKEARVIPIFCKPCDFKDMPFEKLQGFPKDAKPITSFDDDNIPLSEIAKALRLIVEEMNTK